MNKKNKLFEELKKIAIQEDVLKEGKKSIGDIRARNKLLDKYRNPKDIDQEDIVNFNNPELFSFKKPYDVGRAPTLSANQTLGVPGGFPTVKKQSPKSDKSTSSLRDETPMSSEDLKHLIDEPKRQAKNEKARKKDIKQGKKLSRAQRILYGKRAMVQDKIRALIKQTAVDFRVLYDFIQDKNVTQKQEDIIHNGLTLFSELEKVFVNDSHQDDIRIDEGVLDWWRNRKADKRGREFISDDEYISKAQEHKINTQLEKVLNRIRARLSKIIAYANKLGIDEKFSKAQRIILTNIYRYLGNSKHYDLYMSQPERFKTTPDNSKFEKEEVTEYEYPYASNEFQKSAEELSKIVDQQTYINKLSPRDQKTVDIVQQGIDTAQNFEQSSEKVAKAKQPNLKDMREFVVISQQIIKMRQQIARLKKNGATDGDLWFLKSAISQLEGIFKSLMSQYIIKQVAQDPAPEPEKVQQAAKEVQDQSKEIGQELSQEIEQNTQDVTQEPDKRENDVEELEQFTNKEDEEEDLDFDVEELEQFTNKEDEEEDLDFDIDVVDDTIVFDDDIPSDDDESVSVVSEEMTTQEENFLAKCAQGFKKTWETLTGYGPSSVSPQTVMLEVFKRFKKENKTNDLSKESLLKIESFLNGRGLDKISFTSAKLETFYQNFFKLQKEYTEERLDNNNEEPEELNDEEFVDGLEMGMLDSSSSNIIKERVIPYLFKFLEGKLEKQYNEADERLDRDQGIKELGKYIQVVIDTTVSTFNDENFLEKIGLQFEDYQNIVEQGKFISKNLKLALEEENIKQAVVQKMSDYLTASFAGKNEKLINKLATTLEDSYKNIVKQEDIKNVSEGVFEYLPPDKDLSDFEKLQDFEKAFNQYVGSTLESLKNRTAKNKYQKYLDSYVEKASSHANIKTKKKAQNRIQGMKLLLDIYEGNLDQDQQRYYNTIAETLDKAYAKVVGSLGKLDQKTLTQVFYNYTTLRKIIGQFKNVKSLQGWPSNIAIIMMMMLEGAGEGKEKFGTKENIMTIIRYLILPMSSWINRKGFSLSAITTSLQKAMSTVEKLFADEQIDKFNQKYGSNTVSSKKQEEKQEEENKETLSEKPPRAPSESQEEKIESEVEEEEVEEEEVEEEEVEDLLNDVSFDDFDDEF